MYGFEKLAMDALLDLGLPEDEAEREIEDFMNSSFYRDMDEDEGDYEEDGDENGDYEKDIIDVEYEEVE